MHYVSLTKSLYRVRVGNNATMQQCSYIAHRTKPETITAASTIKGEDVKCNHRRQLQQYISPLRSVLDISSGPSLPHPV